MPRPSAVVRVKSLLAFVGALVAGVRAGGGDIQARNLGRQTWLAGTFPRYWFPGQVRQQGAGVYVHPFFVVSNEVTGSRVVGLGDEVLPCPTPGYVMLVTRYQVVWTVEAGLLVQTTAFVGADITTGSALEESAAAYVTVDDSGPEPVIVTQQSDAVRVELLAAVDAVGRVCHAVFGSAGFAGPSGVDPTAWVRFTLPLIATAPDS